MAAIDDLIAQVENPELRDKLLREVARMNKQKKFGLVFEEHLPECTPLYEIPVRPGSNVALKTGDINNIYRVLAIKDGKALCNRLADSEKVEFDVTELVCVAQFGEPIYPYLKPIDTVCNAPDSNLWHTLIEADNYHALQLLQYLYAGKVDCIYIDPPYNTGAKDWKYNNDYVDSNDSYRHSKWLSMMKKRLLLAKKLLNPTKGILICAIDDYEQAHLSILFEQEFSEYECCTVIVNHHPQGGSSDNISRTHEYALFLIPRGRKIIKGNKNKNIIETWSLMRGGTDLRNLRSGRPNSFYAIYVNESTMDVIGTGPKLSAKEKYTNDAPEGCFAIYPIGRDGTERVWRYERNSMQHHIEDGNIICSNQKTLKVIKHKSVKYDPVFSVWMNSEYNAGTNGTVLLTNIFGENRFPYPKSLYTVKDCIKYATQDNRNALVLDFFAGSGTTLHAVNLLNAEDGGHRRCIMVTNNEVSDDDAKILTKQGYQPDNDEWKKRGIARFVTWPRTVCSIKGNDISGRPLKGNYGIETESYEADDDIQAISKTTERALKINVYRKVKKQVYPQLAALAKSDGFKANAAFFKLGFLDKTSVRLGKQFKELLPVLWMKAGAIGSCPELESAELPEMLILPKNRFAVLLDENAFSAFEVKVNALPEIETVFIITDYEAGYRAMIGSLHVKNTYQLYRDYLDNFRINQGRD